MAKAPKKEPSKPSGRRGRTVRLDLTEDEHKRIERVAERKGLNKASYCRMVVLERLEADEGSTPR